MEAEIFGGGLLAILVFAGVYGARLLRNMLYHSPQADVRVVKGSKRKEIPEPPRRPKPGGYEEGTVIKRGKHHFLRTVALDDFTKPIWAWLDPDNEEHRKLIPESPHNAVARSIQDSTDRIRMQIDLMQDRNNKLEQQLRERRRSDLEKDLNGRLVDEYHKSYPKPPTVKVSGARITWKMCQTPGCGYVLNHDGPCEDDYPTINTYL